MESQDVVLVSRLPIFRVSVSKVLGLVLVCKNIWLSKTFVNERVFGLLYLQIRNNQSRYEKCQKFKKIANS